MQVIERELLSNYWVTLILLFAFILLFLMKVFRPNRLTGYASSFLIKGFVQKKAKENPSYFSSFHLLLFLFSSTILSLFLFLQFASDKQSFTQFFLFFIFVIIYIAIRFFLDYLMGKLFSVSNEIRYFLFTKSGYLYTFSLLLFPLIILMIFSNINKSLLTYFALLLFMIRFTLIVYNNKNLILSQLFYFMLYLCALEIAPLFILYKLLI